MNQPFSFILLGFIYFLSTLTATTWSEAHLIDGIFTEPTLETGYHLVATIPVGATNLNVTEIRHTNNYLAVRLHDGRYLFNGNYTINWSGIYKAAGTNIVYHRQTNRHLESLTAVGPLLEAIDVMLLYQEPNSGIVYRYHAPPSEALKKGKNNLQMMIADEAPSSSVNFSPAETRHINNRYRNKRKFAWRPSQFTGCSKTCGGGLETRTFVCVRENGQTQVPIKRCHGLEKPPDVQIRCNITPCPPEWRIGSWSECSVTCGIGIRTRRESECVQEINNSLIVRVADGACLMETKSLSRDSKRCVMPACEDDTTIFQTWNNTNNVTPPLWVVGQWSSCSASCGYGKRTRSVTCVTSEQFCSTLEKPSSHEACNTGVDCPANERYESRWLHTEWSRQCSVDCGIGIETRKVVCISDKNHHRDNRCNNEIRPESMRSCSSNRTCGGQWFTGPWSQCSVSCDLGEQTREAICVKVDVNGALKIVLDINCPGIQPERRKPCMERACNSMWFTSSWSRCTRSCGTGSQTREIKCLNQNAQEFDQDFSQCDETERPESRRICNNNPCSKFEFGEESTGSRYIGKSPERRNGLSGIEDCKDKMPNCGLVTQARLCIYPFYKTICCASCLMSRHEET